MPILKTLKSDVKDLVTEDFRVGRTEVGFEGRAAELKRASDLPSISLHPVEALLSEATDQFDGNRDSADEWLAPRLHAMMRLTRREAAETGIWQYLALAAFPEYVRWRHGGAEPATLTSFTGRANDQAFSRLWWVAELCRNGSDYGSAVSAARYKDLIKFTNYPLMRHRPTALAVVEVLDSLRDGNGATSRQVQKLLVALNMAAVPNVLDSIVPQGSEDLDLEWLEATSSLRFEALEHPIGPTRGFVSDDEIEAVRPFVERIATSIDLESVTRAEESANSEEEVSEIAAT